jgi:hypothetical protein
MDGGRHTALTMTMPWDAPMTTLAEVERFVTDGRRIAS